MTQIAARDLVIRYGPEERGRYIEDSNLQVEVLNLTNVKWLHVHGYADVKSLPSGYVDVYFQLNVKECNSRWAEFVKFTVTLPDGQEITNSLSLQPYIGRGYTSIPIAQFEDNYGVGQVKIEMKATNECFEKSITIRGINIHSSAI